MKAYEGQIKINKDGKVFIPEELLKLLPKEDNIRAIFLVDEPIDKHYKSAVSDNKIQEYYYGLPVDEAVYDDF